MNMKKIKGNYRDLWIAGILLICSLIPILNLILFLPLAIYFAILSLRKSKISKQPFWSILTSIIMVIWGFCMFGIALVFFVMYTDNLPFMVIWIIISVVITGMAVYKAVSLKIEKKEMFIKQEEN